MMVQRQDVPIETSSPLAVERLLWQATQLSEWVKSDCAETAARVACMFCFWANNETLTKRAQIAATTVTLQHRRD
jgi:hypothetical protein